MPRQPRKKVARKPPGTPRIPIRDMEELEGQVAEIQERMIQISDSIDQVRKEERQVKLEKKLHEDRQKALDSQQLYDYGLKRFS